MKNSIFLIILCLPFVASANVDDLLFFPKKGEVQGNSSVSLSNSEITGSLNGTNITISSSRTTLNQIFGFGLNDIVAVGIGIKNVSSASGETKVGTTSISSNVKTGLQSPTLLLGGRFKFSNDETLNFNFIDAALYLNPKGSDDSALRSDYYGIGLQSGAMLPEAQQISLNLLYTSYNANSSLENENETDFNVGYQRYLNNFLFLQLKAGLATLSQTKYKSSGDTIKYSNVYTLSLGLGGEIKPNTLDWLVSYQNTRSSIDYTSGAIGINGDLTSNQFNVGVGYLF